MISLWRITPTYARERGKIGICNRSYYESGSIVRGASRDCEVKIYPTRKARVGTAVSAPSPTGSTISTPRDTRIVKFFCNLSKRGNKRKRFLARGR